MKKCICLLLVLVFGITSVSCTAKSKEHSKHNSSATEEMSGINATVTKTETSEGCEFTFEGYFSTKVPSSVSAHDISINSDSTLFNFADSVTLFDVSFAERYQSEEDVIALVKEIASTGSAYPVSSITIDNIRFYGAEIPDYGMTRYIGFVNGYDVTVSLYTDKEHEAFTSFVENTVFTVS